MSRHTVKAFTWIHGKLKTVEHDFLSRWEAEQFANAHNHHVAKIYNEHGAVVNEVVKQPLPESTGVYN